VVPWWRISFEYKIYKLSEEEAKKKEREQYKKDS
jgi:hypothetical protein